MPVDTGASAPLPFPGLCLVLTLQAAVACLYVIGCFRAFPRTASHDALMAAACCLGFAAAACWPAVKKIPVVGGIVDVLPG